MYRGIEILSIDEFNSKMKINIVVFIMSKRGFDFLKEQGVDVVYGLVQRK